MDHVYLRLVKKVDGVTVILFLRRHHHFYDSSHIKILASPIFIFKLLDLKDSLYNYDQSHKIWLRLVERFLSYRGKTWPWANLTPLPPSKYGLKPLICSLGSPVSSVTYALYKPN